MSLFPELRVFAATVLLAASPLLAADTGPEYLEGEEEQDPLANGFLLFQLPFEQERQNLLHLGSFYQHRDYDIAPDREDWALGGSFTAVGSYWDGRVKLAGTAYTSQKLYGPDDKADTGALDRGHEGYSVLGEVYGSLTLGRFAFQGGRYAVNLPYINKSDIRMTPQTFQGAQAIYMISEHWSVGGGVLTDIKPRTETDFISMYEKAGLDADEDVWLGGSVYQPEAGTLAGIYGLHAPDFLDGSYLEFSKRFWLSQENFFQLSGQYTYQRSTGSELGGDFRVTHYGARLTWRDDWYSGSIAYTDYPEEDRLRSPWGSVAGYTSVMINDFNRAEETALLLGGTVDFSSFGVRGLKVNAKAIFGNTPDCGRSASPDQDEYNLNFNYQPALAKLAGLSLQLRFASVRRDNSCRGDDGDDIEEIRFVARYDLGF